MQLLAALSGGRGGGFGGGSPSERHHTTLDIDAIVTRGKNTPVVEDDTAVEINIGLDTTLTRLVFTRHEVKQFNDTEKPDPYPIAYRTAIWTPNRKATTKAMSMTDMSMTVRSTTAMSMTVRTMPKNLPPTNTTKNPLPRNITRNLPPTNTTKNPLTTSITRNLPPTNTTKNPLPTSITRSLPPTNTTRSLPPRSTTRSRLMKAVVVMTADAMMKLATTFADHRLQDWCRPAPA